jgi:hypothetical protein
LAIAAALTGLLGAVDCASSSAAPADRVEARVVPPAGWVPDGLAPPDLSASPELVLASWSAWRPSADLSAHAPRLVSACVLVATSSYSTELEPIALGKIAEFAASTALRVDAIGPLHIVASGPEPSATARGAAGAAREGFVVEEVRESDSTSGDPTAANQAAAVAKTEAEAGAEATAAAGAATETEGEGRRVLERSFLAFPASQGVAGCFALCVGAVQAAPGVAPCAPSVRAARVVGDLGPPPAAGWGIRALLLGVHHPREAVGLAVALSVLGGVVAIATRRRPRRASSSPRRR